jgi:hypothetical protein
MWENQFYSARVSVSAHISWKMAENNNFYIGNKILIFFSVPLNEFLIMAKYQKFVLFAATLLIFSDGNGFHLKRSVLNVWKLERI